MVVILGADGRPASVQPHIGAQYTGEKTGGELNSWRYFSADSNYFVKYTYDLLTAYCTTLYHTSSLARAAVEKPLSYIIGDGLVFRSHVPERILGVEPDAARDWSRRFTELVHLEKLASGYYNYQQELAREARITGDALLFILYRENGDIDFRSSGGWGLNLKMGELGIASNGQDATGVYLNTSSGEVPFWVNDDRQLLLFKNASRPKQLRGFSVYYSEIARAKNLDRWWDATLERAVLESIQLGYFKDQGPLPPLQSKKMAERAKGQGASPQMTETRAHLKPGSMYQVAGGFEFSKPETPGNTFGLANEWTWKSFGAAVGYPPEFLLGQYSTSFTAHKGALNDAWLHIQQERAHFVSQVEREIHKVLLKKFIREGDLEALGDLSNRRIMEAHLQGTYQGPVPGHINPMVEVKAKTEAVAQGFMLRSAGAAQFGHNFWDMMDEWHEQEMRFAQNKIDEQAQIIKKDSEDKNAA